MDSKKLALLCYELADNRKAEDIVVLDVRKLSGITDFFVIASGTSGPHLRAIHNEITRTIKEKLDLSPECADGSLSTNWIVLDYFDVIVHIMLPDTRDFYDLEGLWSDAPKVSPRRKKAVAMA